MTGFHPVCYRSDQKHCHLLQILQLCRFKLVPPHKVRPAGVYFKSVGDLFTRKQSIVEFFHARERFIHTMTKSSHPNIYIDSYLKSN